MFTLTWITEKELERVIEKKGDEFRRKKNMEIQSGGEKMRNASVHQGENSEQRHFLHKTCNPGSFWQFHVVVVQNNDNEMYKKSVLHEQSCFFAN